MVASEPMISPPNSVQPFGPKTCGCYASFIDEDAAISAPSGASAMSTLSWRPGSKKRSLHKVSSGLTARQTEDNRLAVNKFTTRITLAKQLLPLMQQYLAS